jgi:putative MATE family efflux protein
MASETDPQQAQSNPQNGSGPAGNGGSNWRNRNGGGRGRRGGGGWRGRDLTEGSIPKNLWGLAWPQSVEGVLRVVDQMADLVWAGFLGTKSIAGIGVAQQYTQMAWTARQGVDTAQRAMVSRAVGMGDLTLANHVVLQCATVTFGFFLIVASIGIFLTEPLLRLLGVSAAVIEEAVPYMRLQFMGQGVIGFQMLSGHALAAAGDTFTPMKATMVSRIIHIFLSPALVFGLLFFPDLGIAGAALAAIVANAVGLVMNMHALMTGRSRLHLKLSEYRIDPHMIWQIVKVGTPAALNGAERSIAQLVLTRFVTPFGDNALAAFTLTRRVEMFSNLGSQGFGQAAGIIVGQNLGAGKPERARKTIVWAIAYVVSVKSVFCTLLFLFPDVFLSLFTRDQELLDIGSTWIRIQVFGYLAMGATQVLMQSYQTAGDTLFPALVTLVAMWLVEVPMAAILPNAGLGLGQYGIAVAVMMAAFARLVMLVPYYFTGRWMRVRVFDMPTRQAATQPAVAGGT